MDGTLGEIRLFAGNFPPKYWAFCDGSSQQIGNYDTLYALIGTTYGGDGQNTFNLPDLRGRVPVGTGQGIGLANITLGQVGGTETTTMSINQMPAHNHGTLASSIAIPAVKGVGNTASPSNNVLAGLALAYTTLDSDSTLKVQSTPITMASTGSSNSFSIVQPYLSTNYIICMQGIFPSRN